MSFRCRVATPRERRHTLIRCLPPYVDGRHADAFAMAADDAMSC